MYYWIFKMYNYDDLINYVGLSSYQIVIMICSSLMIWPSGLNNVAPMFLMETPPFHAQQAWLDQRVEFELGLNQFWWKVLAVFDPDREFDPKRVKIDSVQRSTELNSPKLWNALPGRVLDDIWG